MNLVDVLINNRKHKDIPLPASWPAINADEYIEDLLKNGFTDILLQTETFANRTALQTILAHLTKIGVKYAVGPYIFLGSGGTRFLSSRCSAIYVDCRSWDMDSIKASLYTSFSQRFIKSMLLTDSRIR